VAFVVRKIHFLIPCNHVLMATPSEAIAIALEHHQAGRLTVAEDIYRRVLAVEPDEPDALHLLGVILHQRGRHAEALPYLDRAVTLRPGVASYHNNRGEAYRTLGNLAMAIACYERAVQLDPTYAVALNNLGNAWKEQGQLSAAADCYRRAVQCQPEYAAAHTNLGHVLCCLGDLEAAVASCRRALQIQPELAEAHNNLAVALQAQGKLDEAIAQYQQALRWKPNLAETYNNLGNACLLQGDFAAAAAHCQRAVELSPTHPQALHNLGCALHNLGQLEAAVNCCRRALELNPHDAEAYNNLGNALQAQGMSEEAFACYRKAMELNPQQGTVAQNHLCGLRYLPARTRDDFHVAAADYERQHAAPLRASWRPHANTPQPERPLRLGFVSPRFTFGPVGTLLIRTLEHLDRQQFSLAFYSAARVADRMTGRFQALAALWRDVTLWHDEQLAEQIRADGIDILFDLAGHAPHNRLLAFARKPAPVQITWIDSVGPTGLAAMDYVLADRYTLPPETEPYGTEDVLRMPECYVCFEPPRDVPPVGPLPALKRGGVTFGSFNNPAKIHRQVLELWSRIVQRVPGSRLVLKYSGLDDPGTRRHFAARFADSGLRPEQVEMRGPTSYPACLAEYGEIDIALDPFPHTGGLTTCDALWMGVPVVTCPGELFAGRQSLSYLSTIGLTETIASDLDQYLELATGLALDLPRLAALRAGLRQQMAASPLCDGARAAENLALLLREVWRRWCAQQEGHGP